MKTVRRWKNWAGNQHATPTAGLKIAESEADVVAAVRQAARESLTVRAVGAGHSFTDTAVSGDLMIDVSALTGIVDHDPLAQRVTVRAGTKLFDLNPALRQIGLALPNLGDIDRQTVAGALATATHGTGAGFRCIADAVRHVRWVDANGDVAAVDESNSELLAHAAVSLGAFGVMTEVTLQCVPAFNLRAIEDTVDIDECLDTFDDIAAKIDHVEFVWFPSTNRAARKRNHRTTDEPQGRSRVKQILDDELLANVMLGIGTKVGRRWPELAPRMVNSVLTPGESVEYVAASYDVFCSPRRVRFIEMEYAVPRHELLTAFRRVRAFANAQSSPITFPIEVRVLGADSLPMSMASGRDSGFIAVHVEAGSSHESYFAGVEAIMAEHQGRPHWGKLHRLGPERLRALYPGFDRFAEVRSERDPNGRFLNPYLRRVLGL